MPQKTLSSSGWKSAGVHEVTLPSGFSVKIRVPNLPHLVRTGYFPNQMVQESLKALENAPEQKVTEDLIRQQADFYDKLIAATVVEPEITEDDVKDLPFEDVELLVRLATRQQDVDALGHQIGGLHTQEDWQRFRGLTDQLEALAGV